MRSLAENNDDCKARLWDRGGSGYRLILHIKQRTPTARNMNKWLQSGIQIQDESGASVRMMLNSSTPSASSARTIQVLSTREEAKKQYHYAPDFHSIRFSANLITLIRNSSTHNSTMTTLQSVKVPSKMGENIGGMVEVFHRCYFLFTDCVWRHTLVKLCVSTLLVQAEKEGK